MSETAEKLKPVLAALSSEDRVELTQYLLGLEDGEPGLAREEWDEAWAAEINRRLADLDAGKTQDVPAEEVFRKLRERHG